MTSSELIPAAVLNRKAVVYVRQSTQSQVMTSWSLPLAVLTAVPFAVFGAIVAIYLRGLANDVYFQIGHYVDRPCGKECHSDR